MKSFIKKLFDNDLFQTIAIIITGLIILVVFSIIGATESNAQDYVRQGNKFIQVSNNTKDTLVTDLCVVDNKGVELPIIINKANGRCWVWKTSAKTGKKYKQYLRNDLSESIAHELNVEFKPVKAKK